MSKLSRLVRKIKSKKHEWKLIDDYSGFQIYASEAIVNPEYLTITHIKEYDNPAWDSLPIAMPEEYFPPHVRIQTTPSNGYEGIDVTQIITYDIDVLAINLNTTNIDVTRYAPFSDESEVDTDIL
jgi:hypothetical protein